jgi:hypothetical protein
MLRVLNWKTPKTSAEFNRENRPVNVRLGVSSPRRAHPKATETMDNR